MSAWDAYPQDYRSQEVRQIIRAVCAGECIAVIGLSGSGKSNLVGFVANRVAPETDCARFTLVDCNRLAELSLAAFYRLLLQSIDRESWQATSSIAERETNENLLALVETSLDNALSDGGGGVCLILDRFDALFSSGQFVSIANSLRALRDVYKYRLTYVIASRRSLPVDNELSELFFGRVIWLGPMVTSDAMWSARRDARRLSAWGERDWSDDILERLVKVSGAYPSFLRAACEAYSGGAELNESALLQHPVVHRRLEDFWADSPNEAALAASRLDSHPWLLRGSNAESTTIQGSDSQLTAKESRLLEHLQAHAGKVCEKDELVQAVWPEDVIFERGIRDESLAQLVRRLRTKIETNPSEPQRLITIPGRGYLYRD